MLGALMSRSAGARSPSPSRRLLRDTPDCTRSSPTTGDIMDMCSTLIRFYSGRADFSGRCIVSLLQELHHPLHWRLVHEWYLGTIKAFRAAYPDCRDVPVTSNSLAIFLMDMLVFFDRRTPVLEQQANTTPLEDLKQTLVAMRGGAEAIAADPTCHANAICQGLQSMSTLERHAFEVWNRPFTAAAPPINGSDGRLLQFISNVRFIHAFFCALPAQQARALFLFKEGGSSRVKRRSPSSVSSMEEHQARVKRPSPSSVASASNTSSVEQQAHHTSHASHASHASRVRHVVWLRR
jgi:hypothetical protein